MRIPLFDRTRTFRQKKISMKTSLMIVGAGANQIGLFQKARELGLDTVGIDGNPQAPGLVHATVGEVADILDARLIQRLAERHGVSGIYAAAELAVEAVALASSAMGLPGLPPEVAHRTRNKLAMRQALDKAGMPNPKYCAATTAAEARDGASRVGFPMIVKPVDGNASKGVVRIDRMEELDSAFAGACRRSPGGAVLLEAYLEGVEFCVDGLVYDGEYRLGGITGKEVSPLPYRFDLGIFMPPLESDALCAEIERCASDALRAIGFTNGTSHVEIIATADGPRVVEIAGRPGGGRIPSDLIPLAYGQDFLADSIRISLGEAPIEERQHRRGVALYWFPAAPGVVREIAGVADAQALGGVREVVFQTKPGDTLAPIIDCVTRDGVGYVLTEGETAETAVATAKSALKCCRVITG